MSDREPTPEVSVFVVDDEARARRSLTRLLQVSGYRVRAFASARELVEAVDPATPGCLLLDLHLEETDGLTVQRQLAERGLAWPIVFLSGRADLSSGVRAMKQGALDFLEKPPKTDELLAALDRALSLDARQRARARKTAKRQALRDSLTPREDQVYQEIVRGRLNKQIAKKLGISERTVKHHRSNLMTKLGVSSVAELARFAAVENGERKVPERS